MAATKATATTDIRPTDSKEFPQGYGDFILQSSDHVLFYFSPAILAYVSPFFKDMFAISNHASSPAAINNEQPLVMEEDALTLSLLLRHVDPLKESPPIDATTISRLIRAANKYQIDSVIQWFSKQVFSTPQMILLEPPSINNKYWRDIKWFSARESAFIYINPLLVLSISEQWCLDQVSRRALQVLAAAPSTTLQIDGVATSYNMFRHILKLREQRISWYQERVEQCRSKFPVDRRSKCPECRVGFIEWILICTRSIQSTPGWDSIRHSKSSLDKECEACKKAGFHASWSWNSRKFDWAIDFDGWERDAMAMEAQLPDLPK